MKKVFTDIEQSKRLSEIIPTNTADGCYEYVVYDNGVKNYVYSYSPAKKNDIPAWSLNALVELFPAYKDDNTSTFTLTRGGYSPSFTSNWFACWGNWSFNAREPIDAVVGLILLLKENNVEL